MKSYGELEIQSGTKFLKVEAGSPQDIRLLDDAPEEKLIHGFGKDSIVCNGTGCGHCSSGEKPKQRFKAKIYSHTLKNLLDWDFGAAIAKQLKAIAVTLSEEGKKITEVDLKVEASGQNKDKKYVVTPRMSVKPLPDNIIPF